MLNNTPLNSSALNGVVDSGDEQVVITGSITSNAQSASQSLTAAVGDVIIGNIASAAQSADQAMAGSMTVEGSIQSSAQAADQSMVAGSGTVVTGSIQTTGQSADQSMSGTAEQIVTGSIQTAGDSADQSMSGSVTGVTAGSVISVAQPASQSIVADVIITGAINSVADSADQGISTGIIGVVTGAIQSNAQEATQSLDQNLVVTGSINSVAQSAEQFSYGGDVLVVVGNIDTQAQPATQRAGIEVPPDILIEDWRDTIYNWLTNALNMTVIRADQNGNRPEPPYATYKITDIESPRHGNVKYNNPRTHEIYRNFHTFTLSVNIYDEGGEFAHTGLQSSTRHWPNRQILRREEISLLDYGIINDLSELGDNFYRPRFQCDYQMRGVIQNSVAIEVYPIDTFVVQGIYRT